MISPTLQDSFTVEISNSWQQTDRMAKAWIPSEWWANNSSDLVSSDQIVTGRSNVTPSQLHREDVVVLSSSQTAPGDGWFPTQLPPEAPVRKCGRRGWSLRRQPLFLHGGGVDVGGLSLSFPLSLCWSSSRRFTSSRLVDEGYFSSLKAAT